MNPSDRLAARALLLDEVYLRASKAEHDRDQAQAESARHCRALADLVNDRSDTDDVRWAISRVTAS